MPRITPLPSVPTTTPDQVAAASVLVAAGHRMVIPMDFQEMYLKPKTAKQAVVEAGFTEAGE
jgi:hypothetical protein